MKHSAYIDRSSRAKFISKEFEIRPFSFIRSNNFLSLSQRSYGAFLLYFTKPYFVRFHNYCIFTSRSKSIIRDFKVSRMVFKRLASFGLLHGVKKGSW